MVDNLHIWRAADERAVVVRRPYETPDEIPPRRQRDVVQVRRVLMQPALR